MKVTTTLATCTAPDGTQLVLQQHDEEYFLKVDGVQLMSTTANLSEQTMAELACAILPKRPRILIGGLGFGFTLRRVLEICPQDATVVVAELLPEIAAWNREFLYQVNGHCLDDKRVVLRMGDVNDALHVDAKDRYDAILMDVDNSPDPLVQHSNARLYNRSGIAKVQAALQPKGRVVYWSANQDKAFARLLQKAFPNVECIGAKAYPKARRFTHTLFVADRG
jgi:spermidine synthase